jgi:tripartite-type tricarboxylate transporter receptor subunit TctC
MLRCAAAMIVAGVAVLARPVFAADSVADFYKGKIVTLVCSSSTGGGYDLLARTIAKYLGGHVPGAPRIVVQNMPGAGGIVAMNYLYGIAAKDGTVIASTQNNTPFEPLLGTREAKYDATKLNWLGSPSQEVGLIVVWASVPVNNVADLRTHSITVGSSGANSTPSFYARLLNETLGAKMKIVVGYPGQTEALLAMERGEVDGFPSLFYSTLTSTKPSWLKDKKIKVLVQYGLQKEPALANVPSALDLATTPENKQLLTVGLAEVGIGRPYLMPPGVPAARVAAMRKALSDTFNDPKFLADATRMQLLVKAPRTGEQIQQLVESIYRSPPAVIDRLRKLTAAQ